MSTPEMTLAAYRQGYDDATAKLQTELAKLREELEGLRGWFRDELVRMKLLGELGGPKEESIREILSPPSEARQQQAEKETQT